MDDAKKPRIMSSGSSCRLNGSLMNGGLQRRSVQNEELKKLEDEIKKAYMLKALQAQLLEQDANRMAEGIQERIEAEVKEYQHILSTEKDRTKEIERQQRIVELRSALKRQVDEKQEERILLEEEERRERAILHELDRVREKQEELEKAQNKEQLAEQLTLEYLLQTEIQSIGRQKLEELEAKEEIKNQKYTEMVDKRHEHLKKLRLDAQKRREEAILTVAKMLLELQEEKSERQRILADILIEEVKFAAEIEAREAALVRKQKMHDLAESLKEQIRFEEECKRRFVEREREFAEAILAKVMESEKMEQLTAEVKKRRRLQYRSELEQLMKERDRVRGEELAKLRLELEMDGLKDEASREEARRARMQLLESHIDHISEFMSKKSLYDEERGVVERSRKQK